MRRALIIQLGMKEEDLDGGLLDQLYRLDFVKPGYGNKSAKFICKLLPQLQQGLGYSEACTAVGYRHSNSPPAKRSPSAYFWRRYRCCSAMSCVSPSSRRSSTR